MKGILPLRIDGAWLAIDAADVVEILGRRSWTAVPGASTLAPGVIAFRGRAIAAIDLGTLRGGAPALVAGEERARVVIARHGASTFALLADGVREVQELTSVGDSSVDPADVTAIDLDGEQIPVIALGAMLDAALARA
jgi:chemotaxis-related protein WspB